MRRPLTLASLFLFACAMASVPLFASTVATSAAPLPRQPTTYCGDPGTDGSMDTGAGTMITCVTKVTNTITGINLVTGAVSGSALCQGHGMHGPRVWPTASRCSRLQDRQEEPRPCCHRRAAVQRRWLRRRQCARVQRRGHQQLRWREAACQERGDRQSMCRVGARHHRLQPVPRHDYQRHDHAVQRLKLRRRPGRLQLHRQRQDHLVAALQDPPVQQLKLRRRLVVELHRQRDDQYPRRTDARPDRPQAEGDADHQADHQADDQADDQADGQAERPRHGRPRRRDLEPRQRRPY